MSKGFIRLRQPACHGLGHLGFRLFPGRVVSESVNNRNGHHAHVPVRKLAPDQPAMVIDLLNGHGRVGWTLFRHHHSPSFVKHGALHNGIFPRLHRSGKPFSPTQPIIQRIRQNILLFYRPGSLFNPSARRAIQSSLISAVWSSTNSYAILREKTSVRHRHSRSPRARNAGDSPAPRGQCPDAADRGTRWLRALTARVGRGN